MITIKAVFPIDLEDPLTITGFDDFICTIDDIQYTVNTEGSQSTINVFRGAEFAEVTIGAENVYCAEGPHKGCALYGIQSLERGEDVVLALETENGVLGRIYKPTTLIISDENSTINIDVNDPVSDCEIWTGQTHDHDRVYTPIEFLQELGLFKN